MIRDSIDLMVKDLIKNTVYNLNKNNIKNISNIYRLKRPIVCFSEKYLEIEKEIRFFLRTKMYNNKNVLTKNNNGKKIVHDLFNSIKKKPSKFLSKKELNGDKHRAIADFISGMTDRFAIKLHKSIK